MDLRAQKVVGCRWSKGSEMYDAALLEITTRKGKFFKFMLCVKVVCSSVEGKDDVFYGIELTEKATEKAKVIGRYFAPDGGGTKNFPRRRSDRWREINSSVAQIIDDIPGAGPRKFKRPLSLLRTGAGDCFWSGYLSKRSWQI